MGETMAVGILVEAILVVVSSALDQQKSLCVATKNLFISIIRSHLYLRYPAAIHVMYTRPPQQRCY